MPTAPPRYHPTRSGRDRRAGSDRRRADRRRRVVAVPVERRRGVDRRARAERRSRGDRRRDWAARRGAVGASGAGSAGTIEAPPLSARDRTRARMLPDDFVISSGDTVERLTKVIRRKWANAPRQVRAGLVDGLVPILEPLARGNSVTEAMRDACEEVVATWLGPFRRT